MRGQKVVEVEEESAQCAECRQRVKLVHIGAATGRVLNFHLDGLHGACAGSYLPASGTAVAR